MRIAVIGAGAVGAVIAAAGAPTHEVTVVTRTPIDRLELVTGPGSSMTGGVLPVRLSTGPIAEAFDVVFVTVKATDNPSVAPWLGRLCGPGTMVVVVQNGLDQQERLPLPAGTGATAGLAYLAAERLGPGLVRHLNGDLLVVDAGAAEVAGAALPGMRVRGEADMRTACWQKLLGNLVANPLTALTMRRITVMREPAIADLARGLLTEAVAVGRAEGADLDAGLIEAIVEGATRWGPETGSSMLYDRLAGRPTEHQFLTGEVVRRGTIHGLPTPLNAAILALLAALDQGREEQ